MECVAALLELEGRSAEDIFGFPDHLKLKSSATLFASVAPEGSVFATLLEIGGTRDEQTLRLLDAPVDSA